MRNVVIRVDGDPAIGIGHLRRCLVLARAMTDAGYDLRFIRRRRCEEGWQQGLSDFPTSWLEDVSAAAASTEGSPGELEDADATAYLLGDVTHNEGWVVVDHYGLACPWERKIRETGRRLLALDDFRDRRHSADLLVSDSPEPFVPALNDNPASAVELVGFQYALIDTEFTYSEPMDAHAEEPPRVLVTFGGSDPTQETARVCHALRRLRERQRERASFGAVDFVAGPANPLRRSLEQWAARLPGAAAHVAPVSLAPLIRRASLVITSGGNTMVEALALRKPCLVIMTAANQRLMVEQLRAKGLITVAGSYPELDDRGLASVIERVLADLPALSSKVRERSCFDHLGPSRVVAAMRRFETRGCSATAASSG